MLTQPIYWTSEMPAYHSVKGWEYEVARATIVAMLKVKFRRIETMIEKADMMFKAASSAKDSRLMCKYQMITIRLYEASNRVAEALIFDYKEKLS